jgi:hypothetical protein
MSQNRVSGTINPEENRIKLRIGVHRVENFAAR